MKSVMIDTIKGFEDIKGYSVDDQGRVFSHFKRHNQGWIILPEPRRELKPCPARKGYLKVFLGKGNGEKLSISVHKLVALAFIPNPDNKPQINHIDADKNNNRVENLEWVTNEENHRHKCEHGLNVVGKGETHYMRLRGYKEGDHHCCKRVKKYDLNGNFLAEYKSVKLAAKDVGVDYTNIVKVCSGKIKTAAGFKWSY